MRNNVPTGVITKKIKVSGYTVESINYIKTKKNISISDALLRGLQMTESAVREEGRMGMSVNGIDDETLSTFSGYDLFVELSQDLDPTIVNQLTLELHPKTWLRLDRLVTLTGCLDIDEFICKSAIFYRHLLERIDCGYDVYRESWSELDSREYYSGI